MNSRNRTKTAATAILTENDLTWESPAADISDALLQNGWDEEDERWLRWLV